MHVHDLRPDPTAPRPASPVAPIREDERTSKPAAAPVPPAGDSVEISDDARSLAAEGASDVPSGTLAPERLIELRRRIQERAHDSDEVADAVMQRLIERGEI